MTTRIKLADIIIEAHRTGCDIEARKIITMEMAKGDASWNPQWMAVGDTFNLSDLEFRVKPKVTYYRAWEDIEGVPVIGIDKSDAQFPTFDKWRRDRFPGTRIKHLFDKTVEE